MQLKLAQLSFHNILPTKQRAETWRCSVIADSPVEQQHQFMQITETTSFGSENKAERVKVQPKDQSAKIMSNMNGGFYKTSLFFIFSSHYLHRAQGGGQAGPTETMTLTLKTRVCDLWPMFC